MNMDFYLSIPILVTIAGLILIILSLVTIKIKDIGGNTTNSKIAFCVGVLLVIGGIGLAIFGITGLSGSGGYANPTPTPTPITTPTLTPTPNPTAAEINIVYPSNSATVQMKETITGTAKNIPDGQQLWIAISPQGEEFYPQIPVVVLNDGSWSLPVQFGEVQNVGTKFDIYAVLADKNAQNTLNNYINESKNTNLWKGMSVLPDGTITITKLTVVRA
jgi:hypothetical protein